jgi:N-acyl-D-amino-acid deacylase
MDDLLIRSGHLIDGTGAPGRAADVSISAGRIVAIERRSARPAHRAIDARGQVVAPGFIDIHTHSDFTLPLNPRAESKIRQGVTLEVVGNCGFSAAPALPERLAMLREYLAPSAPGLELGRATFAEYVAAFPATAVNVIFQVGHNTLRLMTAGMESRPVTADESATMERLIAEALAAGAWGLSSGLFTAPGCYADSAEILALARVLRRHGAAYSSHIRDEANHVDEAVREAIAVAETTGVHVQIAHLKLSGVDNWGGAGRLLSEIAAARRRGLPVDCDAYPYDTATNPLRNLLPRWVIEGGIRRCSSASAALKCARDFARTSRGTASIISDAFHRGTRCASRWRRTFRRRRAARSGKSRGGAAWIRSTASAIFSSPTAERRAS